MLAMMFIGGAVTVPTAKAQVQIQVNIGSQPLWGPVGYNQAQYYYIPDAGCYYDINRSVFVYPQGGQWITGPSLPGPYANIDLYRVHKVVINQPSPWLHDRDYRAQYGSYKGRYDQTAIRDSHINKYYANPQHPRHNEWHDNGNHNGDQNHGGYHDNGNHNGNHDNGNHNGQH
ncbi:hypothetical protein DN068_19735 [Taibaiella soli]|uniref:Uncharacterized protein n=2 Tax=Taibaiella soli TaxID=1649169 RepID=A0A2W2BC12_9BACT|nr:hypothetical protein DN068_19735 [Taibaiella soli]